MQKYPLCTLLYFFLAEVVYAVFEYQQFTGINLIVRITFGNVDTPVNYIYQYAEIRHSVSVNKAL